MAERPWQSFFPVDTLDADTLLWEQFENVTGVQQGRGLNGEPPPVRPAGIIRFSDTPGYYGERIDIQEDEITRARKVGTFGDVADLTDLVAKRTQQLMVRYLDRLELNIWTLLENGTISVPAATGAIIDSRTYLRQTISRNQSWLLPSVASPLADFRALKLLARGHSVDFGAGAVAYMNQSTANQLLVNTNAADLYGRRTSGLGTFNNMTEISTLMLGDDLPTIKVYDESYLTDGSVNAQASDLTQYGAYSLFLTTGTVIVVGRRPNNEPVGRYYQTRNANNPGNAAGPYMSVKDNASEFGGIPRKVAVHHGFNGFPCIQFPSAICVMTVN